LKLFNAPPTLTDISDKYQKAGVHKQRYLEALNDVISGVKDHVADKNEEIAALTAAIKEASQSKEAAVRYSAAALAEIEHS
jgi:hypothetical protein